MKILLDTQVFLWYVLDDLRLSERARSIIGDEATGVFISPASYWEIAIKVSLGKYALTVPYETFWNQGIAGNGFEILPIKVEHTAGLIDLPFHHRDPFDRLLVAQALAEDIPLLSRDEALDAYAIERLW